MCVLYCSEFDLFGITLCAALKCTFSYTHTHSHQQTTADNCVRLMDFVQCYLLHYAILYFTCLLISFSVRSYVCAGPASAGSLTPAPNLCVRLFSYCYCCCCFFTSDLFRFTHTHTRTCTRTHSHTPYASPVIVKMWIFSRFSDALPSIIVVGRCWPCAHFVNVIYFHLYICGMRSLAIRLPCLIFDTHSH